MSLGLKIGDPVTFIYASGLVRSGVIEHLALFDLSIADGHSAPIVLLLRNEGVDWARGHGPEVKASLRAAAAIAT